MALSYPNIPLTFQSLLMSLIPQASKSITFYYVLLSEPKK